LFNKIVWLVDWLKIVNLLSICQVNVLNEFMLAMYCVIR